MLILFCRVLVHCEVLCAGTSVKVQNGIMVGVSNVILLVFGFYIPSC